MKLKDYIVLNSAGDYENSPAHQRVDREIQRAIKSVVWPAGGDRFIIAPVDKGNGVSPMKYAFVDGLYAASPPTVWEFEKSIGVGNTRSGPVDAVRTSDGGLFLVEWETGNVSSSSRSLNKILACLYEPTTNVRGGALVVSDRNLARYLTDRVGNIQEIEPYYSVWQNAGFERGIISIYVVDYDATDEGVSLIPKGRDGNGRRRKFKNRRRG